MPLDEADRLMLERIRRGDQAAWAECIARYEGRLLAFVESRLQDRVAAEDVVQESFLGFALGLPNYDGQTPLDAFLFAIAAHKLTDVLRRRSRRPVLRSTEDFTAAEPSDAAGRARPASSLLRSREQRDLEEQVVRQELERLVQHWTARGEFERLKVVELLFVLGWTNKDVATTLGLSEQVIADHKRYAIDKLKTAIARAPWRNVDLRRLGLD